MKKVAVFLPVLILFLCCVSVSAEPPEAKASGCPADQAAAQGSKVLEELHQVMAPAWHEAYPAQNHAALGAAIVKFNAMRPTIESLTPAFKTIERRTKFDAARTRFLELTSRGLEAHTGGSNETLYAVFPDLHDSFEGMAYYLLPLKFPEYESFRVVLDLMIDTHLANKDYKAITTSMGALKIKNDLLQKAPLPEDLKSVEAKAAADIAAIGDKCRELEEACYSTTVLKVEECLKNLKKVCDKFELDYI